MDPNEGLHVHGHHVHHHHGGVKADSNKKPFIFQGTALAIFMFVEFATGFFSHSVALMSDAFHMAVDVVSAFASAWVIGLLRREASPTLTFAYRRADVLMAQAQGALFVVMGILTTWEAIHRLVTPAKVDGPIVTLAALIGISASIAILFVLQRSKKKEEGSMTFEANWRHEIQDLSGFISTAIAGALIAITHISIWDSMASLVVAIIMFTHAWETLKESGEILMESVPDGINLSDVRNFIEAHATKPTIRNLHIWAINEEYTSMSVQIYIEDGVDCHPLQAELREYAEHSLGIDHVTIEALHYDSNKRHVHSVEILAD